ncbi:cytochrome c oxidase assembly protein subunit 11 [Rhodothalassium salexigens DSM 2132]|uniref:Cytochrome c oxidase assembly protein CtaG n=2 Tax=Rhodothalassium salexigens TaxID=1086 RepID=A0A4R2PL03_RHOSA|nr:cytochrome c oxidase assembly protein [Rhodothalassium salexigens]MBB4211448.1 cytochrome c oxidase assembly protein subunit 11 [Rhodothalassium salexigens DSM 2132]MBK1639386.1 cytochrome c oxidase assembly protein [Rhodothalassium salexigens DSM 2132]TCP35368.1 cytochrome c oxidase assembly protein subunit 11 [Rhodothalassium salexigens DSM 2132]
MTDDDADPGPKPVPAQAGNTRLALVLALAVPAMVALSFAAVPLYQAFCQVTGFGGTTQRGEAASRPVLDRTIKVRFAANTDRAMPWDFQPIQGSQTIRIGANGLAFYEAHNPTGQAITGTATYNVTPFKAGQYFAKVDCFCFTEQTLTAGQRMDMPVSYYIDPAIARDPNLDGVEEITLSYTFFVDERATERLRSQDANDAAD